MNRNESNTRKNDINSYVEKEMKHCKKEFKEKIVLCSNDNEVDAAFLRYFIDNFAKLKLKTLIIFNSGEYANNEFKEIFKEACVAHIKEVPNEPVDIAELFSFDGNEIISMQDKESLKDIFFSLCGKADFAISGKPFMLLREFYSDSSHNGRVMSCSVRTKYMMISTDPLPIW